MPGSRPAFLAGALFVSLCILLAGARAEASVVQRYNAAQLEQESDRIVEGVVTEIRSRWNDSHTGLESVIEVAVSRTPKGAHSARIHILQPGGTLDGITQTIVGMPVFQVGQDARLHLRQAQESYYRVLGWQQGVWPLVPFEKVKRYRAPLLSASGDEAFVHFTHNGLVWQADQMPVPYLIHEAGSEDLPLADAKEAIFASFAAWQDVACSSLTYSYQGETTLEVAVDDTNVILWVESDWVYGTEAAAATALSIIPNTPPTADVAFNGVNFTWDIGPISTGTAVQDVQGVLTHELGHFSGLSHTTSSLDTMYVSWIPWKSQRPLSADDKLGLCALYPQEADECINSNQCDEGELCESYELGTLCAPQADVIGTSCDYNQIDCEEFCLFTVADLSAGYCSKYCETDDDCPDRFACDRASAGTSNVRVCFSDDTRRIDAGPLMPEQCASIADCAAGLYCSGEGSCTLDCREDRDCSGSKVCNGVGQCVTDTGGCGCASGNSSQRTLGWILFLACLVCVRFRRRIWR